MVRMSKKSGGALLMASLVTALLVLVAPVAEAAAQFEEVAYYCEWAYVYDYWGNWVTVWQCY